MLQPIGSQRVGYNLVTEQQQLYIKASLVAQWLKKKKKKPACQFRSHKRLWFDQWFRKTSWRRKWQPTPVFLPGKFHGQRSLEGYSPWGCKESDMTDCLNNNKQ